MTITLEVLHDFIRALSALAFFPTDAEAQTRIKVLVKRMCSSVEQLDWLRDRVLTEWSAWEGPGKLRELFASRYKPADERPAANEHGPFITPRHEVITDANGNVRGVRLLSGTEPPRLPPAGMDAEVASECVAMVKHVGGSHPVPRPDRFDVAPVPTDKNCPRCHGSGWLITDEMRCECTWRPRPNPIKIPALAELEAEFRRSLDGGRREPVKTAVERELEIAMAMTPKRTKQEEEAELIELKLKTGYRGPNDPVGTHKETPLGSAPFLVQ